MIIGIDIDDTISDTYETAFAYAQKYTVEELGKSGNINHKNVSHHFYLRELHEWTQQEEYNFWKKYYKKMINELKPLTFAAETINKLKEEGHKIVIITARYPEKSFDVEATTIKWLKDNKIEYDDLVLDADDKKQVAIDKKIDVFIDDSFKNCAAVSEAGVKTFIIETRVNQGLENDNVTRVYSWPQFYSKIKKGEI